MPSSRFAYLAANFSSEGAGGRFCVFGTPAVFDNPACEDCTRYYNVTEYLQKCEPICIIFIAGQPNNNSLIGR
uniref:Uncharacterized protein n=1 Tax=Candidatus Kentrum sp. DK TaxID=2126562 RepID=A0A450STB9_9GAMM|nr:MAG: hypothetical protein BECKDK2373B_GA0170837_106413 [Candidatus Kentron sp. DK]